MNVKKLLLAAGLLVAATVAAPRAASAVFHFALSKSEPAADASVPAPEQIKLWFTEAPQDGSLSVRVVSVDSELIETGEPTQDEEDASLFVTQVEQALEPGRYMISWRGIGDDGHPVTGDIIFAVTAQ